MRRIMLGGVLGAIGLVLSAAPALATGDTCPAPCTKLPKERRAVSMSAVPTPPIGTPLIITTLKKGAKKKVLLVDAMLTTGGYVNPAPDAYHLDLMVNGVFVGEPTLVNPLGVPVDCGLSVAVPDSECTVTAQWWVDMDAAEAAFPGLFIGPPVTVTLLGGSFSGSGNPIDVQVTVQQVKKK
jgi:hypothetical protein